MFDLEAGNLVIGEENGDEHLPFGGKSREKKHRLYNLRYSYTIGCQAVHRGLQFVNLRKRVLVDIDPDGDCLLEVFEDCGGLDDVEVCLQSIPDRVGNR